MFGKTLEIVRGGCKTLGFEALLTGFFSHLATDYGLTRPQIMWLGSESVVEIAGTWPNDFVRMYARRRFERIDPVVLTARASPAPFTWSQVRDRARWPSRQEVEMLDLYAQYLPCDAVCVTGPCGFLLVMAGNLPAAAMSRLARCGAPNLKAVAGALSSRITVIDGLRARGRIGGRRADKVSVAWRRRIRGLGAARLGLSGPRLGLICGGKAD